MFFQSHEIRYQNMPIWLFNMIQYASMRWVQQIRYTNGFHDHLQTTNTHPYTSPVIYHNWSYRCFFSPCSLTSSGRHWKKLLTTGKKLRFTPTLHTGIKILKTLEKKIRICTLNLFAVEISCLYNMCRVWALKHAIAWNLKSSGLE